MIILNILAIVLIIYVVLGVGVYIYHRETVKAMYSWSRAKLIEIILDFFLWPWLLVAIKEENKSL